jgi:hypothetical protein
MSASSEEAPFFSIHLEVANTRVMHSLVPPVHTCDVQHGVPPVHTCDAQHGGAPEDDPQHPVAVAVSIDEATRHHRACHCPALVADADRGAQQHHVLNRSHAVVPEAITHGA